MDENGNYTLIVEDWEGATGLFYNDSTVIVEIVVRDYELFDKLLHQIVSHYTDTERYRILPSTDWYEYEDPVLEVWQNERVR
jgi:hypothetical protein